MYVYMTHSCVWHESSRMSTAPYHHLLHLKNLRCFVPLRFMLWLTRSCMFTWPILVCDENRHERALPHHLLLPRIHLSCLVPLRFMSWLIHVCLHDSFLCVSWIVTNEHCPISSPPLLNESELPCTTQISCHDSFMYIHVTHSCVWRESSRTSAASIITSSPEWIWADSYQSDSSRGCSHSSTSVCHESSRMSTTLVIVIQVRLIHMCVKTQFYVCSDFGGEMWSRASR